MKTAIIYHSSHHSNTKKVLDAIAEGRDVTLIDADSDALPSLIHYDLVGFASGIYYCQFHKSVITAVEKAMMK
jgi:menaquinone-dependent protoporphyrinogen IX oxidase